MKNVLFLLSILYGFALSETCFWNANDQMFYPWSDIHLFEEDKLDLSKMIYMQPTIKNLSTDTSFWAYQSSLDSNFYISISERRIIILQLVEKYPTLEIGTKAFKDVFLNEFSKLVKATVYPHVEKADSLTAHIVEKMMTEGIRDISFVQYNSPTFFGVDTDSAIALDGNGYRSSILDSIRQCKDLNSLSLNNNINKDDVSAAQRFLQKNNEYIFFSEQHFFLYDLNGELLKSGYAKSVYVEKFPVILKLKNGASFLLK